MAQKSLYTPLQGPRIVRLMVLDPGPPSQPVSIRLITTELPTTLQYDALSYVWGDRSVSRDISCDGQVFSVSWNLFWALLRVRHPYEQQLLWADAICINQEDMQERNHQVTLMGVIYSYARVVYLCMGDDPDGGAAAAKSIIAEVTPVLVPENLPTLLEGNGLKHDGRWYAVATLTRRPWFQRAWVLQEAGLASNPQVLYGSVELPYRDLIRVMNLLSRCTWATIFQPRILFIHLDWPDWRQRPSNIAYTFLDLLSHGALLKCSDPRDHIFSFLGHPFAQKPNGNGLIIRPDYAKDPMVHFLELTQTVLQTDGVRVLTMVEHTEKTFTDEFPSWVVRWNVSVVMNDLDRIPPKFRASGNLSSPVIAEGVSLRLDGVVFDVVHNALQFMLSSAGDIRFQIGTSGQSLSLQQLMEALHTHYGDHMIEALCFTLCAAMDTSKRSLRSHAVNLAMALSQNTFDLRNMGLLPTAQQEIMGYWKEIVETCTGRSLVITNMGRCGLAPLLARPGDRCCIFLGASVPFVLRSYRNDGHFKLLGESYIHGFMAGEIEAYLEQGILKKEKIVIL